MSLCLVALSRNPNLEVGRSSSSTLFSFGFSYGCLTKGASEIPLWTSEGAWALSPSLGKCKRGNVLIHQPILQGPSGLCCSFKLPHGGKFFLFFLPFSCCEEEEDTGQDVQEAFLACAALLPGRNWPGYNSLPCGWLPLEDGVRVGRNVPLLGNG